ncbi:MAG: alkylation response protein AidB-like acyl-CoA dehydrogenase [Alphaproteobacteria bacterium]|jgi:alkylation response protein AidB-like acyl-CoA dehydrogenase
MDFSWSKEQQAVKDSVIEFAKTELSSDVLARDEAGIFPMDLWKKCADFGIQSMSVPSQFNSSKKDTEFMNAMLAMEGFGYACSDNGLCFALNTQMWTVQLPIMHFGNDQQKEKYLPALCKGEIIGCHAMTEPEFGSDNYNMQASASKCDGGYVLNGKKVYITLGPIADIVIVFATTDLSLGKWGISAFIVEKGTPGFVQNPVQSKMGLRTVPIGELEFTDCFIPEENRLGPEGSGVGQSLSCLEWERCCILASQLGAMERQLEECLSYARKRKQFGKRIGKFQSISNRIVEMRLRLETSRLLLYKVAWLKKEGKNAMLEAAMLKLHLSECFLESSLDAIRINGARGYLSEYEIERDLRDSIGGVIYAGTSDIQRNIVAGILGL